MDSNKDDTSPEFKPPRPDISSPDISTPDISKRDFSNWIFLGLIFGLLIFVQLFRNSDDSKKLADPSSVDLVARLDIETKSAMSVKASPIRGDSANSEIEKLLKEVTPRRFKEPAAAEIFGLMRYEEGLPVAPTDVASLQASMPNGPVVYQILTTAKFSSTTASLLSAKLPGSTFVGKLLKADLAAKAGRQDERNRLLDRLRSSNELVVGANGLMLAGGLVCWVCFLSRFLGGSVVPLGLPNLPPSLRDADKLAGKALIFFGIYLALGAGSEAIAGVLRARTAIASLLGGLVVVAAYPFAVKNPWGSIKTSFQSLGMSRSSPWKRYVLLGGFGFLLEFPVSMLLGALGEKLLPNQTSIHPAEAVLVGSHDPLLFASLLIMASVQAPLYEETLFRGLLLPAAARLTGSLVAGIALTSILFASIHPQGMGAWLGLSTIATASSLLIFYTKSLAPSIVLHAFHNAFTLILVLLLS